MTHAVFVHIQVHGDAALGGDAWRDLQAQIGFAKCNGSRAIARRDLVGQLCTLLDHRLGLVRCDQARAGHHLTQALSLQRRQLHGQPKRSGRVKQCQRQGSGILALQTHGRQIQQSSVVVAATQAHTQTSGKTV